MFRLILYAIGFLSIPFSLIVMIKIIDYNFEKQEKEKGGFTMTLGDKIRSMSDEELAEFLVNFKNTYGDEYEGEMSCLDWLKSEA